MWQSSSLLGRRFTAHVQRRDDREKYQTQMSETGLFFLFWLPSNVCADMLGKQHTKMLSHHLKQLDEEPRIDEEHFVVLSLQMKRGTVLSGGQCTT